MDRKQKIDYIKEKAPKLGESHKLNIIKMATPESVMVKEEEGTRVHLDILSEEIIEQMYKYIEYTIKQLKDGAI